MVAYKRYTKAEFEYNLSEIREKNYLGYWKDFTNVLLEENPEKEILEYVYALNTKNKSLKILVYSSVDIRTKETRGVGRDAIRVVYRWKTKNGFIYKRIKTHQRLETLFKNLEETLTESSKNPFNIERGDWGSYSEICG